MTDQHNETKPDDLAQASAPPDDHTDSSGPENDIVFECPECGKSLAIDPRGAGLMITCPDCQARIQVPFPEEDEEALDEDLITSGSLTELEDALQAAQLKIHDQSLAIEALTKRRDTLENERTDRSECLRIIKQEMSILQGAIDRVVAALEDLGE